MQRFIFVSIILCLCILVYACAAPPEKKLPKELRHLVLFKLKDGTSADSLKAMEMGFKGLATQIKEVKHFEFGLNNSPENLNQGFTHCFSVTFADEQARAIYLPHPAHQLFVKNYSAIIDKVCVVDYWAEIIK
ncbi:MAG: hypothetical protein RL757_792 [Bacteroidota bacterium]|jgi:hypothetical protein